MKKGKTNWEKVMSQKSIDKRIEATRLGLENKLLSKHKKQIKKGTISEEELKKQAQEHADWLHEQVFESTKRMTKDGKYVLDITRHRLREALIPEIRPKE